MADFEEAREYIETAIREYQPKHIFTLFSGGHDSASATHFAANVLGPRMTAVVHVNTGTGIRATRLYVRERCAQYGWPLREYKATENVAADGTPDPQVYEDIVMEHGFPGPFGHGMMYSRLKQRQLERLARDVGATAGDPMMLISGCRKEESTRRMGTVEPIQLQKRDKRFLWVAPFTNMTAIDCNEYMAAHTIPRNEVKDLIHMSGECLCGAFAHKGELKEIELWFPEDAARIRALEARVRANGFPWGWEDQPPEWWSARKLAAKHGQQDAFQAEAEAEIQYLCVGCNKRDEQAA